MTDIIKFLEKEAEVHDTCADRWAEPNCDEALNDRRIAINLRRAATQLNEARLQIEKLRESIQKIKNSDDNYILLRVFAALSITGELLEPLIAINHEKLLKDGPDNQKA